jgi:hypothetical protein
VVAGATASFESIVARCLACLGVPVVDEPLILQIRRLADHLLAARGEGRRLILMIDDADGLDTHTLLELRLLLAPTATGNALLPVALAGTTSLRQRLTEPPLAMLGASVLLEVALEAAPPVVRLAPAPAPVAEVELPVEDPVPTDDDPMTAITALVPCPLPPPPATPSPVGRWAIATATSVLCASLAFVGVERTPEWEAPVTVAAAPPARPRPPQPEPAPTPAEGPAPVTDPRTGPLSADEARDAVNAFRQAVALGDVEGLRRLLTPLASQHELRGRDDIVASYAYRFERADSDTDILAPERVVLREAGAVVTAPFVAWYRDAAGKPGTLQGTARWHLVRQAGRPRVAQIDYEYALDDDE